MLIAHDLAFALDSVAFARACGLEPDPWQANFLRSHRKRALLLCSRQSGKSTVTAIKALHAAVYIPGALVVIASPSQRQSGEMVRTICQLHGKLDGASPLATDSVLKVELENKSRILALPGTSDTIRGLAAAALVIVDEASRVPDELLAALRPMVAVSDGSIIALTTPAGRRGFFFDAWHGNDAVWHRVEIPAGMCPRISKEFLAEELKALGPARYSEEYDLQFIDDETAVFPTHIIDSAFTREVTPVW
jgi:hypothetical protein